MFKIAKQLGSWESNSYGVKVFIVKMHVTCNYTSIQMQFFYKKEKKALTPPYPSETIKINMNFETRNAT